MILLLLYHSVGKNASSGQCFGKDFHFVTKNTLVNLCFAQKGVFILDKYRQIYGGFGRRNSGEFRCIGIPEDLL